MATANTGARSRPRFYDWLIAQINSNRYGVSWLDEEHTTFCVPWKRLTFNNVIEEDVAIFKAWATENPKYNEADKDPAKWKHNFLCALKSITVNGQKVFEEVRTHSGYFADTHKVFRIHQDGGIRPAPDGSSAASCTSHIGQNTHAEGRGQNSEQNSSQGAPTPLDQELARVIEAISLQNTISAKETHYNTHDWAPGGSAQMLPLVSRASYVTENQPEENSFYDTMDQPPCNPPVAYNPIQEDFICPPALYQLQHSTTQSQQEQHFLPIQPPCPVEQMLNQSSGNAPLTQAGQLAENWTNGSGNLPEEVTFFVSGDEVADVAAIGSNFTTNSFVGPAAAFLQELSTQNLELYGAAGQSHYTASIGAPRRKRARSNDKDRSQDESGDRNLAANGISHGAGASPATQGLSSAMVRQGAIQHGQAPSWKPDDLLQCLQLNIYYRRKHVLHLEVNHDRYLLSYNQGISNHAPHELVRFPSPAHLPDQKQVQYTTRVLEAIQEGLLLEVNKDHKKIYATWLGSSHYKVFWASSGQLARLASIPPPGFLQKNTATEIFNFQTFLEELEQYTLGRRKSPDFTIYLCFGQKFSVNKPKEEKLVLVEIVPKYCVFWYEFVQRRGVSSLNSLITSLQIPSLFDMIEMISSRGW